MKKLILMIAFLLVLTPIIIAQPPFQQEEGTQEGLILRFPPIDVVQRNRDISAHMHVYNSTDGLILTNTSVDCFTHVYNSTGNHIVEQEMDFDDNGIEFELNLLSGNFSGKGLYSFIIWCNSSTSGGFVSGAFEVTSTGQILTTAQSLMHGTILFILILFLAITLFFAVTIDGRNEFSMGKIIKVNFNKYLKQGLYFISYLFLTFAFGMAWVISDNYLNFDIGTTIFQTTFTILWIAVFPVFIMFVIFSLIKFLLDIKLENFRIRNLSPQ